MTPAGNPQGTFSAKPLFNVPDEPFATPLAKAIDTWKSGRHISTSLYGELLSEGYDVQALENQYLTY